MIWKNWLPFGFVIQIMREKLSKYSWMDDYSPTLPTSSDLARERRTRLSITGSNRPCVKSPENNAAAQWTEYPSSGYVNYSSGDVSVGRFIRGIFLPLAARGGDEVLQYMLRSWRWRKLAKIPWREARFAVQSFWWQKLSNSHGRETCAFHFEVRVVF